MNKLWWTVRRHVLERPGYILAPFWRMQAVYWLMSGECRLYIGLCLENAGCIFAPVWRDQAIYWLMYGECRLYIGSCLENAGRILAPARLYIGSCMENAGCILVPVWRIQALDWLKLQTGAKIQHVPSQGKYYTACILQNFLPGPINFLCFITSFRIAL